MKRKSLLFTIVGLIVLSMVLTACSSSGTQSTAGGSDTKGKITQFRVGGAGTSSWIYGALVAISENVKHKNPQLDMIIQSTPGSTVHYGMLQKGELDLGSGYTPTDYWAWNGVAPLYKEKFEGAFYTLAPVTASTTQVVVKASSSIKSISDLNGKKVFVGDPGAASTAMSLELVKILGLNVEQIQTDRNEGYEMVKDGRADALIQSAGAPYSSVIELNSAVPLRMIPFTDEELKKVVDAGPYNFAGELKAGVYDFVKEPVKTLRQIQNINISPKVSDEVAYTLTKAIWESWDDVVKAVPATGEVTAADVVKNVAPIHPGAIKYYEEKGIKIPDKLKP